RVRRPQRRHVTEKPRLEFLGHYAVQHGPACPTVSGAERTEAGISSRLLQHALQLHAVVIVAVDENDDSGVGATDPPRVTSEPSRDLRQHLGLVAEWIDSRIVPRSDDLRYQLGRGTFSGRLLDQDLKLHVTVRDRGNPPRVSGSPTSK